VAAAKSPDTGSAELMEALDDYRQRAQRMARAQYLSSKRLSRRHFLYGVPIVVLSAVVSTSAFASLVENSRTLTLVAGGTSLAVGVLAALQTFLRNEERSEKHRVAAARYSRLQREYDVLRLQFTTGPVNTEQGIRLLAEKVDAHSNLDEESPDTSERLYERARREQGIDTEPAPAEPAPAEVSRSTGAKPAPTATSTSTSTGTPTTASPGTSTASPTGTRTATSTSTSSGTKAGTKAGTSRSARATQGESG
jgi:conflict system pore-forming effector with SLATT domain